MKNYPKYIVAVQHKQSYQDLWSFLEINAKDYNDALTKAIGKGLNAPESEGFFLCSKVRKLHNGLCRYKQVMWVATDGTQDWVEYDPYGYTDIDIDSIDFEY